MKTKRTVFRVLPARVQLGRGWEITRDGKSLSVNLVALEGMTKRATVSKAAGLARAATPAQLVVHNLDGEISEERTYGADPRRTKG